MNLERLRWGEWIAGIAALNLALVTFRAWYKVSGSDAKITAWDALDSGRYLLIATAVVGVFLLLLTAAEQTAEMSVPPGGIAAVVGLAASGYVAYRLATPPDDVLDPDLGLYLGLLSALGVAVGGLLAMREGPATSAYLPPAAAGPVATEGAWQQGGTTPPELGGPAEGGGAWSPAPAAEASTWSPAAPQSPPPATVAGAIGAGTAGQVNPGDEVALTAGGTRYPAGTVATVVSAFAGGALVEVVAPDGAAERFEVPDAGFERVGAGAPAAGESWSPAMPAAAEAGREPDDWGFDEPQAEPEKKVPFWKREIGGKKKGAEAETATLEASAVGDVGAEEQAAEERPGFFKRLFGGGRKAEADGDGFEPSAADEWAEPAVDEPQQAEPVEPAAASPAPEPVAAPPEPEPAPADPEPPAPEPEPEPDVAVVEPEPEPEPEPPAPEPEPPAPEPEAAVVEPEPEPPAPEPEPEPPAPEPEPEPPAPEPEPPAAADAPAAAAAAAAAGDDEPAEKPPAAKKRRRSSGSRKVPKEVADAVAGDAPPKVGDAVQLKVGGGKWNAGTRGTVVDVFSAGVIVEVADDDGRTERLDLPFEAVGPADGA